MTRDRDDKHEHDPTLAAVPAADTINTTPTAGTINSPGGAAGNTGATTGERLPQSPIAASLARYRLEAELGRGGMGEVLSARDEQIGRNVAIKRLRAKPTPEAEARFLREARIQGRLDHPAIVPVHELGRDDEGQPFFAMKQLSGKTLAEVLDQPESARSFTRKQLLRALVDVSLAIQFAHERNVVHRDLKPSNIMLGGYGEVYVLDWGIARISAPGGAGGGDEGDRKSFDDIDSIGEAGQTFAGQLLGTPGYMSPEQIRGQDVDGRADVFALGSILFEILAGQPLYPRGKDALAATVAGAIDASASLRRPDAEIPPELDNACFLATKLERDDRIATARAFGDLVQAYLDGDRDVEVRRELAKIALADARASLARDDDRRGALRAASRALALHPEAPEPAELVGRLMLDPPTKVPPEVHAQVREIAKRALEATATQGNRSMFVVIGFMPILYAGGVDDPWYFIPIPILACLVWFGTWLQNKRDVPWGIVMSMIANMGLVAVFSRLVTPFLVAPAMGIVIAMLFALHRASGRPLLLWIGFSLAILGPWVLEMIGVLSPTMRFTGSELVLDPSGSHVRPEVLLPMFALYVMATMTVAIVMARSLAEAHHATQTRLQLQAWQLRQLVPETS